MLRPIGCAVSTISDTKTILQAGMNPHGIGTLEKIIDIDIVYSSRLRIPVVLNPQVADVR